MTSSSHDATRTTTTDRKARQRKLAARRRRRRGQGMTEYVILVGLIGILMITAVQALKKTLGEAYVKAANQVQERITDRMDAEQ